MSVVDITTTLDQAIAERESCLREAMRLGTQDAWDRYHSATNVVDALIYHAKTGHVTRAPWQRVQIQSAAYRRKPIETISSLIMGGVVVFFILFATAVAVSDLISWIGWWLR